MGSEKQTADEVAKDEFVAWFCKDYPKDTLIFDPAWHAPKIYRRAIFMHERCLTAAMDQVTRLQAELTAANLALQEVREKVKGEAWSCVDALNCRIPVPTEDAAYGAAFVDGYEQAIDTALSQILSLP